MNFKEWLAQEHRKGPFILPIRIVLGLLLMLSVFLLFFVGAGQFPDVLLMLFNSPLALAPLALEGYVFDPPTNLLIFSVLTVTLGFFLFIGFFTRIVAFILCILTLSFFIFKLAVISALSLNAFHIPFRAYPFLITDILLGVLYFLVFLYGPGPYSLDYKLFKE
jgi:uncharacterized membrane protein YphA (DoxX/SURF4 family)